MLVHLRQYKHEEVQFDDNRTTGESQTEDTVDKESEAFFGTDFEEFDIESWETIEYNGDPIQRRSVTIDEVTAVSTPESTIEHPDPDLPGRTLQCRVDGDIEEFEHAELVEIRAEDL